MTKRLSGILKTTESQLLATGFGFTDGPLCHPEGYWEFADISANRVHSLPPGGAAAILREDSGGSNGRPFDLQARVIACEVESRLVTRRELDGSYTPIAELIGNKRLNRPHD